MQKIIILSLCVFVFSPIFVSAGPVIRSGEYVSIDVEQTIEGDFYGLGSTLTLSGTAKEDVYAGGGKVTVNGEVHKDLSIVGGTAHVHGAIGDDLRIVGGDVTIASTVAGDVFVFGGSLTVLSTAQVMGDVIFYGKTLLIEGPVSGTVHGSSDSLRIDTRIDGDVEYTTTRTLVLGDQAHIGGNLTYTGVDEVVRAQGAMIEGEIQKREPSNAPTSPFFHPLIVVCMILLFSTLTWYFIARSMFESLVTKSQSRFGFYGLIGLGAFIVVPIISVVLMVSVVGGVVGVLLFSGYIALLIASYVFGAIMLGGYIQRFVFGRKTVTILAPITGSVAYTIILLSPTFGTFIIFTLFIVSLGVISHALHHIIRQ